jgi:dCMP deaminase
MKEKFIDYYMDVAERTSELSYATRLKVGAIIVKENTILSYGYNGMPAGWDNDCEFVEFMPDEANELIDKREVWQQYPNESLFWINGFQMQKRFKLKTKPEVLHAESNAIAKVSKSTQSSEGSTLFCTHAPCLECAKLIYQSGIKNVYFRDHYRDDAGYKFLKQGNVNVHQHTRSI